jgi:hypothetical protein
MHLRYANGPGPEPASLHQAVRKSTLAVMFQPSHLELKFGSL